MYYELYVDVLFLVNFMMDYLLLLLLKKMLKCTATHGRLLFGAMAGAFLTCLILILPIPYNALKFVLFHTIVNTLMIQAGLKIKGFRNLFKAYLLLYIGSFLFGGVLQAFRPYVKQGSLFFAIAVFGYYIVSKLWDILAAVQKRNQYACKVDLYLGEKVCRVDGIIDSGNGLYDPFTNKPVNILDKAVAREFLGEQRLSGVRYIPYHSIGKKEGVLLAVKIDKMCVHGEQKIWVKEPLVGVSEETIAAEGEYQMILNPNL